MGAPEVTPSPSLDPFEATGCKSGGASMPGYAGMFGEQPPEGWERPPWEPWTFDDVYIFQCEKLSWGAIQRPAHLLLEYHEGFRTPDSCRNDSEYISRDLATIWSDDAAFVQEARKLGLPAILGSFNLTETFAAGVHTSEWTWNATGQPPSRLTLVDNPPNVTVGWRAPLRAFWFNGTTVGYLHILQTDFFNQVGAPIAAGSFAAPMFYARAEKPVFAGTGVSGTSSLLVTSHQYRDLLCTQDA